MSILISALHHGVPGWALLAAVVLGILYTDWQRDVIDREKSPGCVCKAPRTHGARSTSRRRR